MTKDKKLINEEFVKRAIIKWLTNNDYGKHLEFGGLRDKGVDIKVKHNNYGRYYLIETKGESKIRQGQEVAFIYSLGQIITRMNVKKALYKYGLGLPQSSARLAIRRIPYQIAQKLRLCVFSVDIKGKVKLYEPKQLKEIQTKKK